MRAQRSYFMFRRKDGTNLVVYYSADSTARELKKVLPMIDRTLGVLRVRA